MRGSIKTHLEWFLLQASGWLYKSAAFRLGYGLACSLVEIFLPLLLLTFCNVCLIRALRRSYRMQVRQTYSAVFIYFYLNRSQLHRHTSNNIIASYKIHSATITTVKYQGKALTVTDT